MKEMQKKNSIIREAVRQIQQYDIYTRRVDDAEAIRIMAEACSVLKKN